MTPNYSYDDENSAAKIEYQAEELSKKLRYSMANFAQLRFKRAMKLRMQLLETEEEAFS